MNCKSSGFKAATAFCNTKFACGHTAASHTWPWSSAANSHRSPSLVAASKACCTWRQPWASVASCQTLPPSTDPLAAGMAAAEAAGDGKAAAAAGAVTSNWAPGAPAGLTSGMGAAAKGLGIAIGAAPAGTQRSPKCGPCGWAPKDTALNWHVAGASSSKAAVRKWHTIGEASSSEVAARQRHTSGEASSSKAAVRKWQTAGDAHDVAIDRQDTARATAPSPNSESAMDEQMVSPLGKSVTASASSASGSMKVTECMRPFRRRDAVAGEGCAATSARHAFLGAHAHFSESSSDELDPCSASTNLTAIVRDCTSGEKRNERGTDFKALTGSMPSSSTSMKVFLTATCGMASISALEWRGGPLGAPSDPKAPRPLMGR
mmetsp:Transcript_1407/g.4086  ORF Transcript_1407/g.4086 Transcript_1407/m.4086 type:complete len:376 (+) Transcript_1407:713-1840(+)